MQSTTDSNRLGARHIHACPRLAMPQGAFETRHQPGREVSLVDGLVSVTQRAWGLRVGTGVEIGMFDAGVVAPQ